MGVVQGNTGVGAILTFMVKGGAGPTVHQLPGARAGDQVTFCRDAAYATAVDSAVYFEVAVTKDNEIKQTSGDLASHSIAIVLTRPT